MNFDGINLTTSVKEYVLKKQGIKNSLLIDEAVITVRSDITRQAIIAEVFTKLLTYTPPKQPEKVIKEIVYSVPNSWWDMFKKQYKLHDSLPLLFSKPVYTKITEKLEVNCKVDFVYPKAPSFGDKFGDHVVVKTFNGNGNFLY